MNRGLPSTARAGLALSLAAFLFFGGFRLEAFAAGVGQSPRVTRVIKDVKIGAGQATARRAFVNERIAGGSGVRTGGDARAELTFPDRTITRLGGNTFCNLATDAGVVELNEGAILFQAPDAGSSRVKLSTGGITLAIKGTTGLVERHQNHYVKILILEGTARVYLQKLGESVLVEAGQMLITKPGTTALPDAVHFDIAHLYKTSLLTNADFPPLASREAILSEIRKQQSDPAYIRTNLVIYGRGTLVNLLPPAPAPVASGRPAKVSTSPNAPADR